MPSETALLGFCNLVIAEKLDQTASRKKGSRGGRPARPTLDRSPVMP